MTSIKLREKIHSISSNRLVSIPIEWAEICKLKDKVKIGLFESDKYGKFVVIMPVDQEQQEESDEIIENGSL